jgi:hypothetical protein
MRPEIEAYLRAHGATYTSDALRQRLIEAGHAPDEVDAALREWEGERAGAAGTGAVAGAGEEDRRTFRRWALWLHVGALVAMVVVVVLLNGTEALGIALIGAVVLGLFLAVGWAVSVLIGRALLPRTGLTVALVVPIISALGLGGTCLALMESAIPTPPRQGAVELRIDPPLSFEGSGAADCFIQPEAAGFSILAGDLGTLDGRVVSVSIDSFHAHGDPNAPAPAPGEGSVNVRIELYAASGSIPPIAYGTTVDSRLEVETSADVGSGTITFVDLAPEPMGPDPAIPSSEPISGTVTWTCE